jgi:hypothetical protein
VEQFTSLDGPDVIGTDGHERNRSTAAIDEFHLVSFAALVNVNDSPHVTASKLLVRRFCVKYDKGVFGDHGLSSG